MPLYVRRRVPLGRGSWLNLSRSGVSMSERVGPVTVNSRGTVWARLGDGLYWRERIPRSRRRVYPFWVQLAVGLSVSLGLIILAANLV